MDWKDFIPYKQLLAILRHTLAVCGAFLGFKATTWLAAWVFPQEGFLVIIHRLEFFGIILLVVFLLYGVLKEIAKGKDNGQPLLIFVS